MKKSISILLCIALIFSSFSFCFASATSWDTTDQANLNSIKNAVTSGGVLYALVNTIATRLQYNNISIGQMVQNIYNALYYTSGGSNRSVGWWLSTMNSNLVTIAGFLDPTNGNSMAGILQNILNMLSYTDTGQVLKSFIADIWQSSAEFLPLLGNLEKIFRNPNPGSGNSWSSFADIYNNAHRNMFIVSNNQVSPYYYLYTIGDQGVITQPGINWNFGTPIGNLAFINMTMNANLVKSFGYFKVYALENATATQNALNWGSLSTSSFTPVSAIDGIYKWFSSIQAPVARLSYVLANDQEIEARDAATVNQQAVVDNFIDSTGDGSVPTSSFSDVSGLSSGVTSNLSTDASPAQIWDIFNSDHGSWFSQETANQLDTTTRARGSDFETPLLDQQLNEIYKSLGGGK